MATEAIALANACSDLSSDLDCDRLEFLKHHDEFRDDEEENRDKQKRGSKSKHSKKKKHDKHKSHSKDHKDGHAHTGKHKKGKKEKKEFDVNVEEFSENAMKEGDSKAQEYFKTNPKCTETVNKWIETTLDKGISGLKNDFETLQRFVPGPYESTVYERNNATGRNRYRDLPCLDQTRVILKEDVQNDYIHANYVKMEVMQQPVICTQAPLDSTVHDFYRMIIQENVKVIIMLCNFMESGRKICTEYYPQSKSDASMQFEDVTVSCLNTTNLPGDSKVRITWLGLIDKKSDKRYTIRHIHWADWPEHGVPDVSITPFNIFATIRHSTGPIVMHCIEGVSRTGTLLAIEYIFEKILHANASDDSCEMIKEIRNQRALSVRTAMQYVYIHREILQYLQDKGITEMSQRLLEFVDDYDQYFKKYAKEAATPPFQSNDVLADIDDTKTARFGMFATADYFLVPSSYSLSRTQMTPSDNE